MTDSQAHQDRLKRLHFRAWHRGTREADYMIGCFFDRFHAEWSEEDLDHGFEPDEVFLAPLGMEDLVWFETMIEEEDVDILGWALGSLAVPQEYQGPLMDRMRKLDYVDIPR